MKKTLLTLLFAFTGITLLAQAPSRVYTDALTVSVNETTYTMQATVNVEQLEDNYINFVLRNFVLDPEGDPLGVGNIEINNLFVTDRGDYKTFSYNANIRIKEGDDERFNTWIGPNLGNVPLNLKGKMTDDKLFVTIDIDMMEALEQIIKVQFGTDFPAPQKLDSKDLTFPISGSMTTSEGTFALDDLSSMPINITTFDNGTFNLDFGTIMVGLMGEVMPLGTAVIEGAERFSRDSYDDISYKGAITFGGEGMASGMTLNVNLKGKMVNDAVFFTLDVDAKEQLNGVLNFIFGTDFAPATPTGDSKLYPDNLVVTVNEDTTPEIPATVAVTPLSNGGINFTLKNFTLLLDGSSLPVGNINIEDLKLFDGPGYQYFDYTGDLLITEGDDESVALWAGPDLGIIPLRLRGRMTDEKLYVNIDIDMVSLDQMIYVQFGQPILPKEETAIRTITTSAATPRSYDLTGRCIASPRRGIYIQNGKKLVK